MSSSAILVTRYIFAHFVQNRSQQGSQFGIDQTKYLNPSTMIMFRRVSSAIPSRGDGFC